MTVNPKIDPPRLPLHHPKRSMECQDAVAGAFIKFLDDAEAAGWSLPEIIAATNDLGDSILLQEANLEETNHMLRAILARRNQ